MRPILALAFILLATTAHADTYRLMLGGDQIGTLTYSTGSVSARVTDSPLGVGNGTFEATSRPVRLDSGEVVTQYLSNSPAKGRTISVLHDKGVVRDVTVSPSSDATDLSVPAAVPQGMGDPLTTIGALLADRTSCPGTQRFYEGRRAITISPTGSTTEGDTLTCTLSYRVTAGPGHFSPLFIRNASMSVRYTGGKWTDLSLSSGPFTLTVVR